MHPPLGQTGLLAVQESTGHGEVPAERLCPQAPVRLRAGLPASYPGPWRAPGAGMRCAHTPKACSEPRALGLLSLLLLSKAEDSKIFSCKALETPEVQLLRTPISDQGITCKESEGYLTSQFIAPKTTFSTQSKTIIIGEKDTAC